MANYIKIKAADINVADQLSDVILSDVTAVYQGLANGDADADKWTVYAGGKSLIYLLLQPKVKNGQINLFLQLLQIQEDL